MPGVHSLTWISAFVGPRAPAWSRPSVPTIARGDRIVAVVTETARQELPEDARPEAGAGLLAAEQPSAVR